MRITFIGGGNMASALAGGLVSRGQAAKDLRFVEPLADARSRLATCFPGVVVLSQLSAEAVAGADVIVFAVKPQQMRDVALALAPHLAAGVAPLLLTIAAGIRLADLARWIGGTPRLVRAMPNTPALIGRGISGAFAGANVDAAGRAEAATILEAVGELIWVPEEAMLDAVTGVSGSGPAYVFYFLEALEQAARDVGFAPAEARRLAYATVGGAIALAAQSDAEPATLRAQVTSKGGTTERAISVLDAGAVKASIVAAVKAATGRARELGDAFGRDD